MVRIVLIDDSGTSGPAVLKELVTALPPDECSVEYWEIHPSDDCGAPRDLKNFDFSYRVTPMSWSGARDAIRNNPPEILVADLAYERAVDLDTLECMGKDGTGPVAELIRETFDRPVTRRGWLAGAVLVSDFWDANLNGGVVVHSDYWGKLKPLAAKYGRELLGCDAGATSDLVTQVKKVLEKIREGTSGSLNWRERLPAVLKEMPPQLKESFVNNHNFDHRVPVGTYFWWLDTDDIDEEAFRGVLQRGRINVDKSELTWERLKAYSRSETILGSLIASLLEIEQHGYLFGGELSVRLEFACNDSVPKPIANLADIAASEELRTRIKKPLAFGANKRLGALAETLLIHAFIILAGGQSVSARVTFLSELDTLILEGHGPLRSGRRFVPLFTGWNVLASRQDVVETDERIRGDLTNTLCELAKQGFEIMQATSIPMLGRVVKAQSPFRWQTDNDSLRLVGEAPSFYVADEVAQTSFVRIKLRTL